MDRRSAKRSDLAAVSAPAIDWTRKGPVAWWDWVSDYADEHRAPRALPPGVITFSDPGRGLLERLRDRLGR